LVYISINHHAKARPYRNGTFGRTQSSQRKFNANYKLLRSAETHIKFLGKLKLGSTRINPLVQKSEEKGFSDMMKRLAIKYQYLNFASFAALREVKMVSLATRRRTWT